VIKDFPEFYKIDSVKSFTYNKITQQNRNRLLWLDPTVDGMKTGHTEAAGYCMIASAKSQRRRRAPPDLGGAGHLVRPGAHAGKPEAAELGLPELRHRQAVLERPADRHAGNLERLEERGQDRLRQDVMVTVPKAWRPR
jgi:hypothetical protein